jgi:hypothetical protein
MANSFVASRAQLTYALCLPLAVLLGYFLAEPMDSGSVLAVALVIGVLSIPIFMRWYHPMLLFSWNAAIAPFFFPGQAYLWNVLAFVGIGFAVVNRFVSIEARFESVPSITWSLLFLCATVVVTAWLRGGIGVRSFGGSHYGGRYYFLILAAILGYFALTSRRIPLEKARLYSGVYFLSGLTALVPNVVYLAGPAFYFLFYVFPPGMASDQIMGASSLGSSLTRLNGLTFASEAFYCWLFARYGLRGLFDWNKPWRFGLLLLAAAGCAFTGYRSHFILFLLTAGMQFYFEGLFRPGVIVTVLAATLLIGAILVPMVDKLPIVVQRSLCFIPGLPVDPVLKASAQRSSDWRIRMWQDLLPQIPRYLLKGKGYTFDPSEQDLAIESARRYRDQDYGAAMYAGDYHNGPLTLIIPLGIWGVIGFLWFLVAGCKYLYCNSRHSPSELRAINTFLLACFSGRIVYFLFVFGMFPSDLFSFTGIVGLAVCLNGAKKIPQSPAAELETPPRLMQLALSLRRCKRALTPQHAFLF